jgi:hypothetical protein
MIKKIINGKIPFIIISDDEVITIDMEDGTRICDLPATIFPQDIPLVFPPVRFSELSEEECKEYVIQGYLNYGTSKPLGWGWIYNTCDTALNTPKDALISLLKDNDIWLKNWVPVPLHDDQNELYEIEFNNAHADVFLIKIKE